MAETPGLVLLTGTMSDPILIPSILSRVGPDRVTALFPESVQKCLRIHVLFHFLKYNPGTSGSYAES